MVKTDRCKCVDNCSKLCMNFGTQTECDSNICANGSSCSNRRIQKKQFIQTKLFNTEKKGVGVMTMKPIKAGTLIAEYIGEVISEKQYEYRLRKMYPGKAHFYGMQLDKSYVIDATRKGNEARFINHSCHPNCWTEHWIVNGLPRMVIIAIRNIEAKEELSFDYKLNITKSFKTCFCDKCETNLAEMEAVNTKNNRPLFVLPLKKVFTFVCIRVFSYITDRFYN